MKSIDKNEPYIRPNIYGLSSMTILLRMTKLCRNVRDADFDGAMATSMIDEMILANPQTSIAKAMHRYGILSKNAELETEPTDLDDDDYTDSMGRRERFLFYALCDRYQDDQCDDNCWWNFSGMFEDEDIELPQGEYKSENLELQKREVIEYVNVDGILVKDRFKLADNVKEMAFADCGGLHDPAPVAGKIKCANISEKHLFYDTEVTRQIEALKGLLSEERYQQVHRALKDSGLRAGVSCLFYGSPGTGKTESVYQIARKTGRDILTADVSKLKSMWVGESEKNLKGLFSKYRKIAGESAVTPILLFNEANAIFGIRKSGAEGAVDKMENSLQNIIMQEMEDLNGILIATINLTDNLDKAFERRFLYKVRFENPSVQLKAKIWTSLMKDITEDFAMNLSESYNFSGGQIENISLKSIVSSIISGVKPTPEDIERFCREELIGNSPMKKKSGFEEKFFKLPIFGNVEVYLCNQKHKQ